MSEPSEVIVVRAQDVRVDAELDGRPVLVVKMPGDERQIGISLTNHQTLKMVWQLLRQSFDETLLFEPLNKWARGVVETHESVPVSEVGFLLSEDHSHVILGLRFGELLLQIRLDPATTMQLRARIAEEETAIAAAPKTQQ